MIEEKDTNILPMEYTHTKYTQITGFMERETG